LQNGKPAEFPTEFAAVNAANGSPEDGVSACFLAEVSGGPDQHACAVFVSNMMYGLLHLLVINRGLL